MPTEVPDFIISELTGRRRTVYLRGRGLPYRPLTLEAQQRVQTTWLPGSRRGVATILGPEEDKTDIEGYWKDKFLGDPDALPPPVEMLTRRSVASQAAGAFTGTAISSAVDAVRLLDSIREEGQQLQIQWGPIIRFGFLTSFQQKWHNVHDCEWKMTFSFIARDIPRNLDFLANPAAGLADGRNVLQRFLDRLSELLHPDLSIIDEIQDEILSTQQRINSLADDLELLSSGFVNVVNTPTEIGQRFTDSMGAIGSVFSDFCDNIQETDPALMVNDLVTNGPPNISASNTANIEQISDYAEAQLYQRELLDTVRDGRNEAEVRRRLSESPENTTLGTYRARGGEDLRDVSMQYYGTPMQWRTLLEYNQLRDSELIRGQLLIIPRQSMEEGQV